MYEENGLNQTALVLLNKGNEEAHMVIDRWMSTGRWRDASSGEQIEVKRGGVPLELVVPAHGVRVLLRAARNDNPELIAELKRGMNAESAALTRHLAAAGGSEPLARRDQRRVHGLALDQLDDIADQQFARQARVLAHRGERRIDMRGRGDVVEAHDRHIARHREAAVLQRMDYALRDQVARRKHRVELRPESSNCVPAR